MIEVVGPSPTPPAHRMLDKGHFRTQGDTQPWTAARCHRLLRQLQCRLGALRKLIQETRQLHTRNVAKRAGAHHDCHARPSKRTRYTYARRRSTLSKSKDTTTPRRSTRTLGTMKIGECSPVSGGIDFVTPVLRKICSTPASDSSLNKETTPSSPVTSLTTDLHALRRLAPEGHYRIYESIFGWLSSLLKSAEARKPTPHPKSLLGMCLRKVPAALGDIEAWDRETAERDGTRSVWQSAKASIELYGQLEMFGSTTLGWKPLGFVVRAHALSILQEAVSEALFEPKFVRLITDLYLSFDCYQDAAAIVASFPSMLPGPRSPLSMFHETDKMQPLVSIVRSLRRDSTSRVSFQCLSSLVKTRQLPLDWVYTKGFEIVWTAVLQAISTSKPEPSVVNFVCVVVEQLLRTEVGQPSRQNERKHALVNLFAGLTAIALGGKHASSKPTSKFAARRLMHLLDQLVIYVQSGSEATDDDDLLVLVTVRHMLMVGNSHVDIAVRSQVEKECKLFLLGDHGSSSQAQYRNALFLMCSIAQCRGRACGIACHDVLSEICTMLDGLGLPDWFREGLRVDGAFLLAHKTKDLRDLAFAEKIPAATGGFTRRATLFTGWRWEEGISEWVHLSPKSKTNSGSNEDRARNEETSCGQEGLWGRTWKRGRLDRASGSQGITSGVSNNHQGDCQGGDESADELSSEKEDAIGICGRGIGSHARVNIALGGGGDPEQRSRGGIMSRSEEVKPCWSQANSGTSRISMAIKRVKRAGTGTRVGRPRGMSHCGVDDEQGGYDDWDELM